MRFAFDETQVEFADAVRALLADVCTPSDVRECWTNPTGMERARWGRLADMGVIGLTIPERHGGLGLDELDLVGILEATGHAALPEPIVEHVAVAAPMLAENAGDELAARWLPRMASGEVVASVQSQGKPYVLAGAVADVVVLAHGDELHVVPSERFRSSPERSVDGARRIAAVDWHRTSDTLLVAGEAGFAAINRAFDRGALGAAAQLVGLATRMVEMTVAYACEREQFGVPIGSFQAVKHQLADAHLAIEFARPVVHRAAYSLSHGEPDRSRDVSMAKAYASDAALGAARVALQCHGAIGYTVEHDLHLYMKRAWALAAAWGDAAWHRERVAFSVLGPSPMPAAPAADGGRFRIGESLG